MSGEVYESISSRPSAAVTPRTEAPDRGPDRRASGPGGRGMREHLAALVLFTGRYQPGLGHLGTCPCRSWGKGSVSGTSAADVRAFLRSHRIGTVPMAEEPRSAVRARARVTGATGIQRAGVVIFRIRMLPAQAPGRERVAVAAPIPDRLLSLPDDGPREPETRSIHCGAWCRGHCGLLGLQSNLAESSGKT